MSAPRLDHAAWLREGALVRLLATLDTDGEEARVVGGAVRNALLGEPIHEFDIATTAQPDEVIRRAQAQGFKTVPTGIEHGTVTVVIEGRPFEVTTLREDVETFGRHARVAFGRDWKKDAERRDFTINALSVTRDGIVHDYTGGLADLEKRQIRFIGDPAARIAEDYLRILRFFRFHAHYGEGLPDAAGFHACIAARAQLATLSRERAPIGRPALVRLFASVLKREGEKYFLVTPVEKVGITVDDAPFLAVEMRVDGDAAAPVLNFRTNVDDWVACDAGHALRFEPEAGTGGLKPYLHVRRDLWAKVSRPLFYDIVTRGEERRLNGQQMFGVASAGEFFVMAPADSLREFA